MASSSIYTLTRRQQLITDVNGKVKSIILPAKQFEKIIDLLEDYGLGIAIKKTLRDKVYSRKDALNRLEND